MFVLPKFHFNIETWKWSREYKVYVSSFGNIKNEKKEDIPKKINQSGYVSVYIPYIHKFVNLHRLVLKTFKPVADSENLTVDHIDSNKRNNRVDNLEWVTEFENKKRAKENFVSPKECDVKEKNNSTKITVIVSGTETFKNFNEAAMWLLANNGCGCDAPIPRVQRKIYNAIVNKKKYCGRKWRVENRHKNKIV